MEALNRNAFITARLQAKQIAVDRRIILDEKKVFFDRIIPKYTTMFCLKSSSKMMKATYRLNYSYINFSRKNEKEILADANLFYGIRVALSR